MKLKEKSNNQISKKSSISILLYVIAAIVAICGIAMLSVNIYIFKSTIDQYVAQGYPVELVMQSMVPSQLLPGIFEPIALYGGLVFALIGIGIVNNKLSNYFMTATESVEKHVAADDTESTDDSVEYDTEYADPIDVDDIEEVANLEDPEIAMEEETKN